MEIKLWKCDTCGQIIKQEQDGWIEWLKEANIHKEYGLRLVHHKIASPLKNTGGCQYNELEEYENHKAVVKDLPLQEFIGPNGLMNL